MIWQKQADCVEHSERLIVPSRAMQRTLERCYPEHARGKVDVLPWGSEAAVPPSDEAVGALRSEFGIAPGAKVLLTLSRVSPEKGQHVLLESLLEWERSYGLTLMEALAAGVPAICLPSHGAEEVPALWRRQ